MREIDFYNQYKEKLSGICDENNLTFSIQNVYPFLLTIKPAGGMDAQQTMMEGMDSGADTGYISSDASLVFAFRDGVLTYKISETWTIGDALFGKLKNLFRKLHSMWMMHFFRDYHENGVSRKVQDATGSAAPLELEIDDITKKLESDASAGDAEDIDDELLAAFYDDTDDTDGGPRGPGDDPAPATVSLSELD